MLNIVTSEVFTCWLDLLGIVNMTVLYVRKYCIGHKSHYMVSIREIIIWLESFIVFLVLASHF